MMTTVPASMLAWQKAFSSHEPIRNEVQVPKAPADGLLIEIRAAGVCHSDLSILRMENRPPHWPKEVFTLGHEGCGEVIEVGHLVSGFKSGDLVAINAVAGCGSQGCGECSRGYPQVCLSQDGERHGLGYDGSYAPYVAIKAKAATKLPDGVSVQQGAVATDACMTAYHAVVGTAQVKKDNTVVIIGLGGLGFNAVQIVQAVGARVIISDKREEVVGEAIRFGVPEEDAVPVGEDLVEFVKRKQLVVDTVIDFVGVPETFNAAQEAVRCGGKLVQVGLLSRQITLHNFVAVLKHLSILCSYGGTMEDLKACLSLIADGKLKPQIEERQLKELPQVLSDLHEGKIKSRVVLVPDKQGE